MLVMTALPLSVQADPVTVDLLAGQDDDVGDITVWNDEDNLYVEFDTTESGELMLETHLAIATSVSGIPQTKKGNPIPGQFEYTTNHMGGTTNYVYMIPLEWISGTDLYIAAHASLGQELTMTLFSGADQGIVVYGPVSAYAPVGDAAWGTPVPAVATYVHPSWPSIAGATWISNTYYIGEPIAASSWRWVNHEFTVPGYPLSGSITITADNAEDVYLNTVFVGSDGEVQDPWVDNYEWGTVLTHPMYPLEGINDLDIIVRNYPGSSSPTANPTGLIYTMAVNYIESGESAWGEGCQFDGANWAMYFTYTVHGWVQKEVLTIPALNTPVVPSSISFQSGKLYKIVASGTAFAGDTIEFDAEYSITARIPGDTWTDSVSGYESYGPNLLDLKVNGAFIDWGAYNSDHIYEYQLTGTGSPVTFQFQIYDIYPPNNYGSLTVTIYEWA